MIQILIKLLDNSNFIQYIWDADRLELNKNGHIKKN